MWRLAARKGFFVAIGVFVIGSFCFSPAAQGRSSGAAAESKFEISFPSAVHGAPITGRVVLVITRHNDVEPRFQANDWDNVVVPIFGADANALRPGAALIIDANTAGFPLRSLRDLPAGDYYVQAVLNVYTQCHRADGHDLWVHLDQWEGQQFNLSPGNLISEVKQFHLDTAAGFDIPIVLNKIIPPVEAPADTEFVKHIKFQSASLTKFWGCPIHLGAIVLLPKGYADHPQSQYPVIYLQGHFSLDAPFGFDPSAPETHPTYDEVQRAHDHLNVAEPPRPLRLASEALLMPETAYEFTRAWTSDNFPRMIAVTFQHPNPYFDDSYDANSVNVGPYGDALMQELIPEVETRFRIIREPYARALTGGSTGGWESLALQLYHPDFFGGTWTFYPDPIDFRRWGIVNIYDDKNYFDAAEEWIHPQRYVQRSSFGQPRVTNHEITDLETVLGTKMRSGGQLAIWQAVYGPIGDDGYPKPLWDPRTGDIDHSVAAYMRDHGYDLRYYLESNWPKLGSSLIDKIHLYSGDMDNYYLNLAVYLMEDFLVNTKDPYYGGSFQYGRPMKGHGWQPTSNFQLVKTIAEQISRTTPQGEDAAVWHY
jgi:Putative esterase